MYQSTSRALFRGDEFPEKGSQAALRRQLAHPFRASAFWTHLILRYGFDSRYTHAIEMLLIIDYTTRTRSAFHKQIETSRIKQIQK